MPSDRLKSAVAIFPTQAPTISANAVRSLSNNARVSGVIRSSHNRTASSSAMQGIVARVTRWLGRNSLTSSAVAKWNNPA